MNIFTKIKNSIYNPEYYKEVLQKPFSYSLKYFVLFSLLFALVFAIVFTIKFVPVGKMLSDKAPELANYFPQELTVTIKDGKASTNVQEPYYIKMPENFKSSSNYQTNTYYNGLDNIIVINTKDKFDLDTFNSYKTLMLLTSNSMVYLNKDKQIAINSLSGAENLTLNREKIVAFINMVKPFFVYIYPFVFVGGYLVGLIVVSNKLIYLLFGALLIWVVAKIKGLKIGYKKSYQFGMHLVTFAVIVTSLLSLISPKLSFPFLFSVLLILLAVFNLDKSAENEALVV